MSRNACVEECLMCKEEKPVCNCGECPPICATCATLALPRILAHVVLADLDAPCSYTQLQLALRDLQLRYWQEAAYLLHTQVPGHTYEEEAEDDLVEPGPCRGGLPLGPSVN